MSEALDRLDHAIREAVREIGPGLVTGWVVLTDIHDADPDGFTSGCVRLMPDDGIPWVQGLGLIEAARLQMRREYLDEGREDT